MYRLKRRDLQAGRASIGIADQHFIHAETTGVEGHENSLAVMRHVVAS